MRLPRENHISSAIERVGSATSVRCSSKECDPLNSHFCTADDPNVLNNTLHECSVYPIHATLVNNIAARGSDLNFAASPIRSVVDSSPSTNTVSSPSPPVRSTRLYPSSTNRSRRCQDATTRSNYGGFHYHWGVDGSGPQVDAILFY